MAALTSLTQAIKAVPTATASVLLFVPQTQQAIAALLSLTAQDVALLAVVLPLLTLFIVLSISTNRSVLASRGKFVEVWEQGIEERRKARVKDAIAIAHECTRQQQVYLVGSAGVGKSTLIRLLLMDNLREGNRLLPFLKPLPCSLEHTRRRAPFNTTDMSYVSCGTRGQSVSRWSCRDPTLRARPMRNG